MSTRAEKRAIKRAANAHVKKMVQLSSELKNCKLSDRVKIAWYIITRSGM